VKTMQETIDILLVDDEARNLDALEAILDEPTYRLLRAGDADKALRLLLDNDVAAIVLDIKMPGVSGIELAQIIKGTKKCRQIPIVFLTAFMVEDEDVLTGYGAGGVDYLTKPVNPAILRHKVAVFADLFRKTRALAEFNETLETRVQERTAKLEKSEAALRETSRQKDVFLATLAHELRNPLAPLRTGLDILLRHAERPAALERTLVAMNRQLDYMVRLIDDLLDVSRISRGTLEIRKEVVDLSSVIERAMETVAPSLARRDQTVVVDAENPFMALVDVTRIAQIVANLLNNASKHSEPGAPVRIHLRRAGEEAVIRVVDEGVGIPADQLERVFGMFTKIERSPQSANDGLGIGLALSRYLAELHGGTLTGHSAGEGHGATFTLSIPLAGADSEMPVDDAAKPREVAADRVAGAGLRVVLVEDNEDAADMMVYWLEQLGHDVRVARTGPEAVAVIVDTRPAVVLCDIGLPGLDGLDVCRRVVEAMPAPPVMVALTGWGRDADLDRTDHAGFRHHLVKPVEPDKLRVLLDSIGSKDGIAPLPTIPR
jgi:signal transduction histidine kinase